MERICITIKPFNSDTDRERYKYACTANIEAKARQLGYNVRTSHDLSGWHNEFSNIKIWLSKAEICENLDAFFQALENKYGLEIENWDFY